MKLSPLAPFGKNKSAGVVVALTGYINVRREGSPVEIYWRGVGNRFPATWAPSLRQAQVHKRVQIETKIWESQFNTLSWPTLLAMKKEVGNQVRDRRWTVVRTLLFQLKRDQKEFIIIIIYFLRE